MLLFYKYCIDNLCSSTNCLGVKNTTCSCTLKNVLKDYIMVHDVLKIMIVLLVNVCKLNNS